MPDPLAIDALLSGRQTGPRAAILRGLLGVAEPAYAGVMRLRNWLYDARVLRPRRLPVPVISVGNITTGGVGKTPIVQWLAGRARSAGLAPAILLRGYKARQISDEQDLLQESLPGTLVYANPDRFAGGRAVLAEHPNVKLFILDDGFQHRRLGRDFDLVVIDATNAFGYGHVLPRGLLREPLGGLARAHAFVLSRSDQIHTDDRARLLDYLRAVNHTAPVYRTRHVLAGLRCPGRSAAEEPDMPIETLAATPFFAFAGIANPFALQRQLTAFGATCRGHRWFTDHHDYTAADLADLRQQAAAADAGLLITTEKDWRKIRRLPPQDTATLRRLALRIDFDPPGEDGLFDLILTRIDTPPAARHSDVD